MRECATGQEVAWQRQWQLSSLKSQLYADFHVPPSFFVLGRCSHCMHATWHVPADPSSAHVSAHQAAPACCIPTCVCPLAQLLVARHGVAHDAHGTCHALARALHPARRAVQMWHGGVKPDGRLQVHEQALALLLGRAGVV